MRRKIWEDTDTQCSIIGTCLSLKELLKIARQTGFVLLDDKDEFLVHTQFVQACSMPSAVSKAVNKTLNRKYAGAVRIFSKADNDEEIFALWMKSMDTGDIPGPYWAIMTHQDASVALRRKVFGDVHMLSHLVGSSNRADIRHLTELEDKIAEMHSRHMKSKAIYRERVRKLIQENRSLGGRLHKVAKEAESLRGQAKKYGTEILYKENQDLEASLASMSARYAELKTRFESDQKKLAAYELQAGNLAKELQDKQVEIDFLETELTKIMCTRPGPCEKAGTDQCPGPELCGKRILYVGGRANLVPHYKEVVERHGGELLHHDGGLEQTRHKLPKMISTADAVLCPVDCISHDACQCVKDMCKNTMKPCKLLRSSGLSSLARSLEELMNPDTALKINTGA